jgi:hypothetical protein
MTDPAVPDPLNLDQIKARRAAITRPPWRVHDRIGEAWRRSRPSHEESAQWHWDILGREDDDSIVATEHGEAGVWKREDAEFIAHAPDDTDHLIGEVERLRKADQEAFEIIGDLLGWMKRKHGGDPKLHPEEYYRLSEYAQRWLDDYDRASKT